MVAMNYNPDHPIIVAFAGEAGVGKTSTANAIVPNARWYSVDNPDTAIVWDHTYFSAPLYELVSIKSTIQGINTADRLLYAIHDVVYPMLRGYCSYDDLIELVYDIWHMQIVRDENDKPRDFFQQCGDKFRGLYLNCFADQAIRTIKSGHIEVKRDFNNADFEAPLYIGIISDLRMRNEYEAIRRQPNSIVIKLDAPDDVRRQRMIERGSRPLNETQKEHISEAELRTFSDDEFDLIIDTTQFDGPLAQGQYIKEQIMSLIGNGVTL